MSIGGSRLPKYRKHQSGRAIVTLNGRDYYLGPHGSKASTREYDRIIAEYLASGRSPTFGAEADAYTVAMLLADYPRHCRAYYGTEKTSEYFRIKPAVKRLHDLYADHEAAAFSPIGFKAVRQTMIDGGWSRPYVNSCAKKVLRAFKWAASEGRIINPPLRNTSKGTQRAQYQNDKTSYNALYDLLTRATLLGAIPWDATTDETRPTSGTRFTRDADGSTKTLFACYSVVKQT